jgi:hypothetical protein
VEQRERFVAVDRLMETLMVVQGSRTVSIVQNSMIFKLSSISNCLKLQNHSIPIPQLSSISPQLCSQHAAMFAAITLKRIHFLNLQTSPITSDASADL